MTGLVIIGIVVALVVALHYYEDHRNHPRNRKQP
jgi:hypothetical protein